MNEKLLSRVLYWAAMNALAASQKLEQLGEATRDEAGKLLAQLMTPEEREKFSVERYTASAWEPDARRGLPAWEAHWFATTLPKPPAKVLVAACGTGRELLPLIYEGYEVRAFDGAQGPLEIARKVCPQGTPILQGTFRDLINAVDGSTTPLSSFVAEKYDAVILGWGSLTHVAGSRERRAVLKACHQLTEGPLMTSFYSSSSDELAQGAQERAVRWGRRLAAGIGRSAGPSVVEFSDWGGFAEYISKEEVAMHAAALGRNVEWDEGNSRSFPHVTLVRSSM